MFAKTIVLSDAFLDLPIGSRCLYYTLGMLADDDGFINNPRSVMRQVGASPDDLKILEDKKFILTFEDGVVCIKHWRINNYLRSDRYTETKYTENKNKLLIDKNGSYSFNEGRPAESVKEAIAAIPTVKEIEDYIKENNYNVDASAFFNYYNENGWKDSKGFSAANNWKQKIISWNLHSETRHKKKMGGNAGYKQTKISDAEFDALFEALSV